MTVKKVDYLNVAFIPCNSLLRLVEWIKEPSAITHMNAVRGYRSGAKWIKSSVPFIKIKDMSLKSVYLEYSSLGKHGYKTFPVKEVLNEMENSDVNDISVRKLELMVDSKEFYDKYLKNESVTKSEDSRFILSFISKPTKNEGLRKDISRFTAYQIDKLHFKYETIDLIGIFTVADRKSGNNANLMPPSNQDTKMLKDAMKLVFIDAPLRIRSYNSKGRISWELAGYEEFK